MVLNRLADAVGFDKMRRAVNFDAGQHIAMEEVAADESMCAIGRGEDTRAERFDEAVIFDNEVIAANFDAVGDVIFERGLEKPDGESANVNEIAPQQKAWNFHAALGDEADGRFRCARSVDGDASFIVDACGDNDGIACLNGVCGVLERPPWVGFGAWGRVGVVGGKVVGCRVHVKS